MEFSNKWIKSSSPGLSSRVKTAVRPEGPIKPRLETAVKSLENQISKLQNKLNQVKTKCKKIRDKYDEIMIEIFKR